ncbi:MAG: hypothetical protein KGM49_08285 [Sphingomonadales bacterium]|nr:hypothetical protein [Sphingomonadales bacterium]
MSFRPLIAVAVLVFGIAPANATTESQGPLPSIACEGAAATDLAKARSIVGVAFPDGAQSDNLGKLLSALTEQIRTAWQPDLSDPELMALLNAKMRSVPTVLRPLLDRHLPRILDATACAYVHKFTPQELTSISEFAHTPAGSRFLAESPKLVADPTVAAVNQDYLKELRQVAQEFQNSVRDDVIAYLAKKQAKPSKR